MIIKIKIFLFTPLYVTTIKFQLENKILKAHPILLDRVRVPLQFRDMYFNSFPQVYRYTLEKGSKTILT